MRIAILGAGAVGGYFGGRLVEAGRDVTFIVRPQRKERLDREGLRIESPAAGDFAGPVTAVTPDAIDAAFDVVLVSCKAYDLEEAISAIGPAVGPDTVVVPLLNGMQHMALLREAFGDRVAGGLVKIAVTLRPDGAIHHLNDWQFITFGALESLPGGQLHGLRDAFEGTTVKADLVPDIRRRMWEKLVHLATVAGMTTLMRASIGEIVRTDHGAALNLRLLEDNARIAAREGFPMTEEFLAQYRDLFADPASPYTASMLRDMERGGPIEGDHIMGHMHRLSERHGVDTDLYAIILTHLQAYEVRRADARP